MGHEQQIKCSHCDAVIPHEDQGGFCPRCGEPIVVAVPEDAQPAGSASQPRLSDREALNVMTDTVVGPNVRLRDNLYQALAIGIAVLLGAGAGAVIGLVAGPDDRGFNAAAGAVCGGIVGLLVGTLGSGLFLAIYRLVRHARGRHD